MMKEAAAFMDRVRQSRPRDVPRHSVPLDILVVDDDEATRLSLAAALVDAGHRVTEASDGAEVLELCATRTFDVALVDVRLPKVDGLTLARRFRQDAPQTSVILMTAFATVPDAVAALRDGAYDYVTKPFDPEELTLRVIGHIAEHRALRAELEEARRLMASRDAGSPIVGQSPAMVQLVERVSTVAQSDVPVMLRGEPGTGKELVAHTIHARSPRKTAPFIAVSCAAFPPELLERELFGFEDGGRRTKGRLEMANGGTLFLDEIADLPLSAQARLRRVLEEGVVTPLGSGERIDVNVRVMVATRFDPRELVTRGVLREDLFFRIHVVDMQVPPLRERKGDLPLLLAHFLRKFYPGRVPPSIAPRCWAALTGYDYPGNVREFAHAVERAVVLARGSEIDVEHLPLDIIEHAERLREAHVAEDRVSGAVLKGSNGPETKPAGPSAPSGEAQAHREVDGDALEPLAFALAAFERDYLVRAMRASGGDKARACRLLGVSRRVLTRKLATYDVKAEEIGAPMSGPSR